MAIEVAKATSSSSTPITINLSRMSLRNLETTTLNVSPDNSPFLLLAEKATMNSSTVKEQVAKICLSNSKTLSRTSSLFPCDIS
ncbi:MAG: hypothetical protein QXU11_05080 [Thermoproteota archaeon]